jgi:hypothetical protein
MEHKKLSIRWRRIRVRRCEPKNHTGPQIAIGATGRDALGTFREATYPWELLGTFREATYPPVVNNRDTSNE